MRLRALDGGACIGVGPHRSNGLCKLGRAGAACVGWGCVLRMGLRAMGLHALGRAARMGLPHSNGFVNWVGLGLVDRAARVG
jgi:hypothetical protein